MNSQFATNRGFRAALVSFMVALLLTILLLASLGTSWGVAYGQSAGPPDTNNVTTAAATTVAAKTTGAAAVGNSGSAPQDPQSAVNDANQSPNQSPVGVVPGLPNTGTGTSTSDDGWKLGVLALLVLNMLVAGMVMRRYARAGKAAK